MQQKDLKCPLHSSYHRVRIQPSWMKYLSRAAARDADAKGTTITGKMPQVALKFRAAARDADAKGTTMFGQKKVEI